MNINAIYRHPAELEAEAMLSVSNLIRKILRWRNAQRSV